jgi:serine/threonine protein kinase
VKSILKNPAISEQVAKEIDIGTKFVHPNIMKIYRCFFTQKHYHLILEYCPRGTLEKFIKEVKPNEETAIKLFKGICNGYKFMHDNGIIHFDMKPLNILVSEENGELVPKICDFGYSQQIYEIGVSQYQTDINVGTPYFESPQILAKQDHSYKSDIYSLGAIFYELLFHNHVFNGGNLIKFTTNVLKGDLKMDTTTISKESADMIVHCLHIDEEGRFSLQEMMAHSIFTKEYKNLTKFKFPQKEQDFSIHSLTVSDDE